jgi:hypothetical protein
MAIKRDARMPLLEARQNARQQFGPGRGHRSNCKMAAMQPAQFVERTLHSAQAVQYLGYVFDHDLSGRSEAQAAGASFH